MSERRQELQAIAERYARRGGADRYSLLRPEVWHMLTEREAALRAVLARREGAPADWRATEVGCGAGGNLLGLLRDLLWRCKGQGARMLTKLKAALAQGVADV